MTLPMQCMPADIAHVLMYQVSCIAQGDRCCYACISTAAPLANRVSMCRCGAGSHLQLHQCILQASPGAVEAVLQARIPVAPLFQCCPQPAVLLCMLLLDSLQWYHALLDSRKLSHLTHNMAMQQAMYDRSNIGRDTKVLLLAVVF